MKKEQFSGILRAVLAALGGYAAGAGWFDSATADALVGAVMTIAVAGWSIWEKRKS